MAADASSDTGVTFGQFRLYPTRHLLLEGDTPVRLGSRARELLVALLEQPGQAVSKEALCARIWPNLVVEDGTLRAQVALLRKALRDGQNGRRYIANIAGRGYAFVGQLAEASPQPATAPERPEAISPLSTARLFGRTDVIDTLARRLVENRVVTIVGPGGIGKTTTALAVADRLRPGLRDGVCFVDLAPLADERLVSSALASALGAGVVSEDPLPSLAAMLRNRDMLIVMDNCEHVIDSAAFLTEAIARTTGTRLRILATSREALGIEAEQVFRLAPLGLPEPDEALTAAAAMTYPAVQLFVERAAMALGEYALTDAHAPAVAKICQRLDGIALAIEIAAGQVDALGVTGLARVLDDRFRLVMQGRRTGLPRHRTMNTALDWSYQLLPELERAAMRRLAVFTGLFTLSDAIGILSEEGADQGTAEHIANLVTKSLIVPNFETPVPTYRLLETTRAYALRMLDESGERDVYARRHARQCLAAMEAANLSWEGSAQEVWLAKHRHLIDDIRAALELTRSEDAATAVALTAAAVPLWYQLSLLNECYERACHALELTETIVDRPRELRLHAAKAWSLMQIKGFVGETEEAWTTVLTQSRESGSVEFQLRGLWGLWATRINAGALRASLDLAREFSAIAEGTSPETTELDRCVGHRMIGHSLHLLGDQAAARHHLERMLENYTPPAAGAQAMRYIFNQATLARSFLARILWLQGYPERARQIAWDLVQEERDRGDSLSLCQVLVQAGCPIGLILGELEAVDGYVTELTTKAERNEWHFWRMFGACFRSVVTVQRGDVEAGLVMLEEALSGLRSIDFGVHYLFFLCEHARSLGLAGQTDRALTVIEGAIARSEKNDERWCIAEAMRIKGTLLRRQGDLEGASRTYVAARKWAEEQGALSWLLRVAISQARLAKGRKQEAAACADLAGILARFSEGHDSLDYRQALATIKRLGGSREMASGRQRS